MVPLSSATRDYFVIRQVRTIRPHFDHLQKELELVDI